MWAFFDYGDAPRALTPGVYWSQPITPAEMPAPADTLRRVWPRPAGADSSTVNERPSFAYYAPQSRTFSVGMWTENMMFTEAMQFVRQHIYPPIRVPIVTLSGTGITASQVICYYAFWDAVHRRRSPLSGGSATLVPANQGFQWTNIPTLIGDDMVTHVELWRSVNGFSPALVTRVDRGVASFFENKATLLLGELFGDPFTAFPTCAYNTIWNFRQVMAGDRQHPDRIYFSPVAQPDRYGGYFLRTRDSRAVTGLAVARETLIVLTGKSSMAVTGYTDDEVRIDYLEPDVGCVSHSGLVNVHDFVIIPSPDQPYLCTGSSMQPIGKGFEKMWKKAYADNQSAWENRAWAVRDAEMECYELHLCSPIADPATVPNPENITFGNSSIVLDYKPIIPQAGGGFALPYLSLDDKTRLEMCGAMMGTADGRRGWLLYGAEDGYIRRCNVMENVDDDGDDSQMYTLIRTNHSYYGKVGGNDDDGKTFVSLWFFITAEQKDYTVWGFFGDDYAGYGEFDYEEIVPAGAAVNPALQPLVPKTRHYAQANKSGHGMTLQFNMVAGRMEFSGFGGTWVPGSANRGTQAIP